MDNLKITIIQADLRWEDPQSNRDHFDQLLKEVPTGADLVLLPETFNTGFLEVIGTNMIEIGTTSRHNFSPSK